MAKHPTKPTALRSVRIYNFAAAAVAADATRFSTRRHVIASAAALAWADLPDAEKRFFLSHVADMTSSVDAEWGPPVEADGAAAIGLAEVTPEPDADYGPSEPVAAPDLGGEG